MACKADVLTRKEHEAILKQATAPLHDSIAHLKYLVEKLQHQIHGRSSEKHVGSESSAMQGALFPEQAPAPVKEELQERAGQTDRRYLRRFR